MLNILQCTGQPPTTENYWAQNVCSVEVEKSWARSCPTLKDCDDFFAGCHNKG